MKKIGTYTLRGQATEGTPYMIRLFDGKFDTGYKIIAVNFFSASFDFSSNPDVIGKVGTSPNLITAANNFWNAEEVREIAWGGMRGSTDTADAGGVSVIDPDNFVVEDLWVYVRAAGDQPVNYLITMEKYDTTDARGALAMVRNNAQNVIGD